MRVTRLLSTAVAVVSFACTALVSSPATAEKVHNPSDNNHPFVIACGGERQYILDLDGVRRYVRCAGGFRFVITDDGVRRYLYGDGSLYYLVDYDGNRFPTLNDGADAPAEQRRPH